MIQSSSGAVQAMSDAVLAIARERSVDTVLQRIVHSARELVQARYAALGVPDGQGNFARFITSGMREELIAAMGPLPRTHGLLGAMLESDESHRKADIRRDPRFRGWWPRAHPQMRSFLGVPIVARGSVIAAFYVTDKEGADEFSGEDQRLIEMLAAHAAVAIENARLYEDLVDKNAALSTANASLEENFRQTIVGFAHALEESDRYTRGHSERVSIYARLIALGLRMNEPEIDQVVQAALLHDIGKIGIRYDKLNKPGKLTPEEISLFRSHPAKGKRILEPIPCMRHLIDGAHCHHEHVDGSGYPQGLMADSIPLLGRIVAVADSYDAMTSDRAYRKALPHNAAVNEIDRCAGSQFDQAVVEVFLHEIEVFRKQRIAAGLEVPR